MTSECKKQLKRIVIKGSVSVVNFTELSLMQNSCRGVTSERQFINPTYLELVGSSHGTLRSYEYSPGSFGFLFRTPFVSAAGARKVFWTRSSLLFLSLPHIFSYLSHSGHTGAKWSMMSWPSEWSECNTELCHASLFQSCIRKHFISPSHFVCSQANFPRQDEAAGRMEVSGYFFTCFHYFATSSFPLTKWQTVW